VVKTIWERVGLWVRAPCLQPANWEDADNVKEWFLQMMNGLPSPMKEGLRSLIVLTIWEVWRERMKQQSFHERMQASAEDYGIHL